MCKSCERRYHCFADSRQSESSRDHRDSHDQSVFNFHETLLQVPAGKLVSLHDYPHFNTPSWSDTPLKLTSYLSYLSDFGSRSKCSLQSSFLLHTFQRHQDCGTERSCKRSQQALQSSPRRPCHQVENFVMVATIMGSWMLKFSAICIVSLISLPFGTSIFAQNLEITSNLTRPSNGESH